MRRDTAVRFIVEVVTLLLAGVAFAFAFGIGWIGGTLAAIGVRWSARVTTR